MTDSGAGESPERRQGEGVHQKAIGSGSEGVGRVVVCTDYKTIHRGLERAQRRSEAARERS